MEKSFKWIAWVLWIVAMIWGVFGVSQRMLHGELQVNYGSYIPWGLWVAGKVYLVGLGVGASLFVWIVYKIFDCFLKEGYLFLKYFLRYFFVLPILNQCVLTADRTCIQISLNNH